MVELLLHYNWKRAVVISSNYNLWLDAGKAIRLVFVQQNITIAYQVSYGLDQATDSYIRSVLIKTTEEGRSELIGIMVSHHPVCCLISQRKTLLLEL